MQCDLGRLAQLRRSAQSLQKLNTDTLVRVI